MAVLNQRVATYSRRLRLFECIQFAVINAHVPTTIAERGRNMTVLDTSCETCV
jgi:hypothetical protein